MHARYAFLIQGFSTVVMSLLVIFWNDAPFRAKITNEKKKDAHSCGHVSVAPKSVAGQKFSILLV